jgi:hypothetical protein
MTAGVAQIALTKTLDNKASAIWLEVPQSGMCGDIREGKIYKEKKVELAHYVCQKLGRQQSSPLSFICSTSITDIACRNVAGSLNYLYHAASRSSRLRPSKLGKGIPTAIYD